MPDYSKMGYTAIANLLAGGGGEKTPRRIAKFNQTTFRKDIGQRTTDKGTFIQSGIGGKPLGDGYCAGVCLDWARRTLLSPSTRAANFINYGYEDMAAGKGTKAGRDLTQSKDRAYQTVGRMAGAWHASGDMDWNAPSGSTTYAVKPETWASTAKTMDSRFEADRKTEKRVKADQPFSKRPFSSLTLLGSRSFVYASAGQWMGALLAHGLKPGAVSKLGFRRSGASGHAVAVWQRKTSLTDPDAFYFFDPNYGVFSYTKEQLQDALQILFWMDNEDTPNYDTCSSATAQEMDWLTFGPIHLVSATTKPASVVSTTVEAVKHPDPGPVTTTTTSVTTPVKPVSPPQPTLPQPAVVKPPEVQAPLTSGYGKPAFALSSPGVVSAKSTVTAPKGSGKHADLIAELETFKAQGKALQEWNGLSYKDLGGLLVLKEPLRKSIEAAVPSMKGSFRVKGVQSGIDVKALTQLISQLKAQ